MCVNSDPQGNLGSCFVPYRDTHPCTHKHKQCNKNVKQLDFCSVRTEVQLFWVTENPHQLCWLTLKLLNGYMFTAGEIWSLLYFSFSRRSWMALNGVATVSAAVESTARWSRPRLKMTRSCAASCTACRPTCSAYGDAKSSPMPSSCGSSGGARSPTSLTSFTVSWKVRESKKDK